MNVVEIVFSPTGGTQKVARTISEHWNKESVKIDLSDGKADFSKYHITEQDMVLVAMPSFGGRAPAVAIERFKTIKGNGARCTLVCVYGNRAYEDTLAEMEDAAKGAGFNVVAAVAAIAEHSIARQYATDRPDSFDQKQLVEFAEQIADKADKAVSIPGNRPYKEAGGGGLIPQLSNSCVKCGSCAEKCPVQAIDSVSLSISPDMCISCMRCVKVCPESARKIDAAVVSMVAGALKEVCSIKKENELYL